MTASHSLPGTPSDQVPAIADCGSGDIGALFLSMARRHPEGRDADYLRWHTLDHRPEQQRLPGLRTSLRVVSTPACRAARAACDPAFAAVDHVMTYFFADVGGLASFGRLAGLLRDAGRSPFILEPVERGTYAVESRIAAPGTTAGSDVLPWVPVPGIYLLLERGEAEGDAAALADVAGIAGVWRASSVPTEFSSAGAGQQLHLCFLDADPLDVARRLRPVLAARWRSPSLAPLLAAPFYSVVPFEWDRHLP
jgi:hypothetical protein